MASPEADKKAIGNGFLSIEKGKIGEKEIRVVVFRNSIGKTLYQGSINGRVSRARKMTEKPYKQQLKVALIQSCKTQHGATEIKVHHCIISFGRGEDLI